MAEKIDSGDNSSSSLQNLTCPLCLDIFEEATLLTCEHTFCRKCLKKYDLSHQDLDHMVCPLCRETTQLSSNRVEDLPANINVNELVDDYHGTSGGVNVVLEMRPKCTSCDFKADAVAFCRTCNDHLCDECLHSHQRLRVFRGHEIVSIQDINEGKVSLGRSSEKCSKHTQEDKDLFCDNCKIHVCHKCVIVGHRDHTVKNQDDFEKELQLKVNDLAERCSLKKSELEKNIYNLEGHRQEVHATMQKLRTEVIKVYSTKAKQLEENQRILIEQIDALEREFNDDLDSLKSSDRQKIKSICSSIDLMANDRLGCLETESLSAHILLCEELESILKEATDHTSAAVIKEKAQKKKFKPADDTRLDIGSISAHVPELHVIQCVDREDSVEGITKYSAGSVAVGYCRSRDGIDIIDSTGNIQPCANLPSDIECYDLAFQSDRTLCMSTSEGEIQIYSSSGSRVKTIQTNSNYYQTVNVSTADEILLAFLGKEVRIYDKTGSTLKHTVPLKHDTLQASATRTGLIIASSCTSDLSIVTVYDRNGNAGKPLQAPSGVYLYAAVDEQDRVYVAIVDCKNGKVVIRLYDIDGLNLNERVEFNTLNLTLNDKWCYLVSLSPNLLAFACDVNLYFIKVLM